MENNQLERGRTRKNLFKWESSEDDSCEGGRVQDDKHIHECPSYVGTSSKEYVDNINGNAIKFGSLMDG